MEAADVSEARERLDAAVSELRMLREHDAPDRFELAAAAQRALDAMEAWPGECQETTPFASVFIAFHDGGKFWRCTHEPPDGPHEYPA